MTRIDRLRFSHAARTDGPAALRPDSTFRGSGTPSAPAPVPDVRPAREQADPAAVALRGLRASMEAALQGNARRYDEVDISAAVQKLSPGLLLARHDARVATGRCVVSSTASSIVASPDHHFLVGPEVMEHLRAASSGDVVGLAHLAYMTLVEDLCPSMSATTGLCAERPRAADAVRSLIETRLRVACGVDETSASLAPAPKSAVYWCAGPNLAVAEWLLRVFPSLREVTYADSCFAHGLSDMSTSPKDAFAQTKPDLALAAPDDVGPELGFGEVRTFPLASGKLIRWAASDALEDPPRGLTPADLSVVRKPGDRGWLSTYSPFWFRRIEELNVGGLLLISTHDSERLPGLFLGYEALGLRSRGVIVADGDDSYALSARESFIALEKAHAVSASDAVRRASLEHAFDQYRYAMIGKESPFRQIIKWSPVKPLGEDPAWRQLDANVNQTQLLVAACELGKVLQAIDPCADPAEPTRERVHDEVRARMFYFANTGSLVGRSVSTLMDDATRTQLKQIRAQVTGHVNDEQARAVDRLAEALTDALHRNPDALRAMADDLWLAREQQRNAGQCRDIDCALSSFLELEGSQRVRMLTLARVTKESKIGVCELVEDRLRWLVQQLPVLEASAGMREVRAELAKLAVLAREERPVEHAHVRLLQAAARYLAQDVHLALRDPSLARALNSSAHKELKALVTSWVDQESEPELKTRAARIFSALEGAI